MWASVFVYVYVYVYVCVYVYVGKCVCLCMCVCVCVCVLPALESALAETAVLALGLCDVSECLPHVTLQLHVHVPLESPQGTAAAT